MPRSFVMPDGQQHVFEDGTPDSVVEKVLGPDALKYTTADTSKVTVRGHVRGKPARRTEGSSKLPFAGGAVGSARAGIPGAYLGGTAGEALRQLSDVGAGGTLAGAGPMGAALGGILEGLSEPENAPTDVGQAFGRLALAGPEQAGYEVLGRGVAKGVELGGVGAMKLAGKFTPESVQTALREGISATKPGFRKVMNLLGNVGQKMQAAVRRAGLRGGWMSTEEVATQVQLAAARKLAAQGIHGEDLAELTKLKDAFMRDNGSYMDLPRSFQVKKSAGNFATLLHKAVERGEPIAAKSPVQQIWEKEMESYLDQRLGTVVPGYHELNQRASDLIRLKQELAPARATDEIGKLLEKAKSPAARTMTGATLGAGAGALVPGDRTHNAEVAALIGALAGNPQAMSWLALRLYGPGAKAVAGQVPRAIGAVSQ